MAIFDFKSYGTEGETPVQDSDIVFHETHNYADPLNGNQTRSQLSTPLFQLKKFINSLFDSNDKIITSNLPSATTSGPGMMSRDDKIKLNGIDNYAQPNVIETVKVEGTALTPSSKEVNIQVSDFPTATTSVTGMMTSTQVSSLEGKQDQLTAGSHIAISDNTISATYSNATSLLDGLMSKEDKKLLDGASSTSGIPWGDLVKRDNFGRFRAESPSSPKDVVNKAYVDAHILPDPTILPVGAVMQVIYDEELGENRWAYTVLPIPATGLGGDVGKAIIADFHGEWYLDDPWNIIHQTGNGEGETQ